MRILKYFNRSQELDLLEAICLSCMHYAGSYNSQVWNKQHTRVLEPMRSDQRSSLKIIKSR